MWFPGSMIRTKSALKFAVLPANEALTCLLDNRTGEHPVKDAPQCLIMRQIRDYKKVRRKQKCLRRTGTAEGIRTPDLLVRSQTLYPAELQPHIVFLAISSTTR